LALSLRRLVGALQGDHMKFHYTCRALLLASLSSSILSSNPLLAQEAADKGYDDEIVVTAQKREENLQNVPISIPA
jgi:iron complex outermembrane receptor protein